VGDVEETDENLHDACPVQGTCEGPKIYEKHNTPIEHREEHMQAVSVPFPCVVYRREKPGEPFQYSHHSQETFRKQLPWSLRVSDLRQFDPLENWRQLCRACFLVLVAGDVARRITLELRGDGHPFLYNGSAYARTNKRGDCLPSELHDTVPLVFHSTMTNLGVGSAPLEAAIVLLPRTLREQELPKIRQWVQAAARRSLSASLIFTDRGDSYNENSLQRKEKRVWVNLITDDKHRKRPRNT